MSRYLHDSEGDSLRIEKASPPYEGAMLSASQRDSGGTVHHAIIGPIDPRALIEAIKAEFELHEDDEVHDSPVVEALAEQINSGEATLSFEEEEEDAPLPPETFPRSYVHTTPATAEEPRVWAGADEPIIDGLIGRVADLEEEKERTEAHEHLAEHWDRRLEVVRTALSMLPAPGKRGGVLAAFAGEDAPQSDRVEKALKIARFAADEDRDIPGVDL